MADLTTLTIQAWLDEMAAGDLGVNTLRCRLSTLSSFCGWLVKRGHLAANPTVPIDRPPREAAMPAVAGPAIMDALIEAAKRRGRPRDLAIFLLLRFTGTQIYTTIRPPQLKRAVGFYEAQAERMLTGSREDLIQV